jgi:hypothetical protein
MKFSQQRRALTLGAGLALVNGGLPGLSMLSAQAAPAQAAALSDDESALVSALTEVIIPADRSPSAVQLGSPAFVIAGLLGTAGDGGAAVRQGLAGIDRVAQQMFGSGFCALGPADKNRVVEYVAGAPEFSPLWLGLRRLTVMHYYAQPAAYRDLGLPGPSIDAGGFPKPNTVACSAAART